MPGVVPVRSHPPTLGLAPPLPATMSWQSWNRQPKGGAKGSWAAGGGKHGGGYGGGKSSPLAWREAASLPPAAAAPGHDVGYHMEQVRRALLANQREMRALESYFEHAQAGASSASSSWESPPPDGPPPWRH